jgi:hypothetical protein
MYHYSYVNQTNSPLLTDFERYDISEDAQKLRWQTLQLISAIANVCRKEKVRGEFPVINCCASRWEEDMNETAYVKEAMELLKECKFEKNFTSSVLRSPENVNHTHMIYDALFNWAQ